MSNSSLFKKLDLEEYINSFEKFLARHKPIAIQGDTALHYKYIQALSSLEFKPPKPAPPLNVQLNRLKKQAILSLSEMHAFVQIIQYFKSLQALSLPILLKEWIGAIEVPKEIETVMGYFTDEGEINSQKDDELLGINEAIIRNKKAIKESLQNILHSKNIQEYLVDTQIHFINDEETILVRGGFSSVIKATVVARSASGFFYILPQSLSDLKNKEASLLSQKETIIFRYCKEFSFVFSTWERFLSFINKEFDRFDHYQARVAFAKAKDYEFVLPEKSSKVILSEFSHPALENPKPISINVDKNILLITGVNAGGKTMLLKSILGAVYMSKYLLPFACNVSKTKIGQFHDVAAIIEDPQNVKNDISTFAGRMVEFSKLFDKKNTIVGVDEIELGTDSDEAASLFRVLLDTLAKRDIVFVVTTHHKRLASLMASHESVELVAALYDEKKRLPTYTFLQGSIGKSYAFETAERYGIPLSVVAKAKEVHGEDKERLNDLIERSTILESQMRTKIKEIELQKNKLDKKYLKLEELEEDLQNRFELEKDTMESAYQEAILKAREAAKAKESKESRRLLNEAFKAKSHKETNIVEAKAKEPLKVGDRIKYRSHKGEIISISGDNAIIEVDGMKMRVSLSMLKKIHETAPPPKPKIPKATANVEKGGASVSIKLIGMFGDEAIDALDRFISDALVHNLREVQVIHGGGKGILAKLVSEYLSSHPKIAKFYRMPGNLGITVVEL
ncbi:MAG: endonuclease MutS2 [Sulfurovaceae bacterium]|nr:endonuclease MutS2 [Sulfurovaceae bacterium]